MSETESTSSVEQSGSRVPWWMIGLGLLLPTLVTWIYFDALSTTTPAIQKGAYSLGKTVQFLLPMIAYWFWMRSPALSKASLPSDDSGLRHVDYRASSLWGVATGLLIGLSIIGLYHYVMLPSGLMDRPRLQAKAKLSELGIASPWLLVGIACFYSLFHSALEEYYWRWFVLRSLKANLPKGNSGLALAVGISSLGFMLHHVLVLARYFGWASPLTYLFSLGVATGGVIWGILYLRNGSLLGPWLSHLMVDAAIFVVAYWLSFG